MNTEERYKKSRKLLSRHGQEHLLDFYTRLNDRQRRELLGQIEDLDFSQISTWIRDYVTNTPEGAVPADFGPATSYPAVPTSLDYLQKYARSRQLGAELISVGKVAAFMVAGGEGTRLGFDGPKGDFAISPVRNKTLFEIFAETILAAGRKYNADLAWYIMTNPNNHAETVRTFESSGFWGLKKSDVFFLQQATNPNFAIDGRILLADKAAISTSPDGHGGCLKALFHSGAIADMKARGIEYISYFQVDNPLVNIFDPLFIGLHALDNAEMSSKALIKAHAMEKVGNFCLVDGKVTVIEYSDLPDELAQKRNPDGSLVFELGSIAIHIINTAFVEKLNADGFALPIHRAVKKISHIDPAGNMLNPAEPNGVKLETFVFDALPLASKSIILQTIRSEEFAPVKNTTGADSAAVAREMMIARAATWLKAAGLSVPGKADGSIDCVIEIAPSFAICKEDVIEKAKDLPPINHGDQIYLK